ncbi:MAG: FecR domain-containing protein, partial [Bdellovibrionales bacterium]|nr:FecR domain-containing protein [Bdellovibrionales bacterium]
MDKKLITGALALLIIQIALLAFDVNFDLAGHDSREKSHAKDIGVVTIKKQNVKKRSQGSVVWEDSERGSRLKSNDSILTLENSSAQIELSNDIKIDLQENTLIVLEPQKDQNTDSFRIRFSRGHVRSQTSNQKLELKSETWDIAAAPGSTISLKGLEGDRLEVEISSGSAQLKNSEHPNSIQQISTGSRLTLADSNIEKTEKISESLNLLMKPEMRVYTHSFPVQHFVHWEGSAQRLRIVHPDQKIQYISVNKNENSKVLTLHEGTHYLSLENENSVSKEITFRILEAPKIRYTSPLPRDRYLKGDRILFSWLPIENSIQYELELTNQATERDVLISKKTLIQSDVQVEGSIQMRVFGEDDLGFRIPPHYSQALFILQEALSPPQLHNPEIRSPASPVSSPPLPPLLPPPPDRPVKKEHRDNEVRLIPRSPGGLPLALLRLFFNFAHAAETTSQKHVTLSWYAVPGADFYNVEISSDPGFLQPEVTEKVDKEIFMWSNFSNKIYYW